MKKRAFQSIAPLLCSLRCAHGVTPAGIALVVKPASELQKTRIHVGRCGTATQRVAGRVEEQIAGLLLSDSNVVTIAVVARVVRTRCHQKYRTETTCSSAVRIFVGYPDVSL